MRRGDDGRAVRYVERAAWCGCRRARAAAVGDVRRHAANYASTDLGPPAVRSSHTDAYNRLVEQPYRRLQPSGCAPRASQHTAAYACSSAARSRIARGTSARCAMRHMALSARAGADATADTDSGRRWSDGYAQSELCRDGPVAWLALCQRLRSSVGVCRCVSLYGSRRGALLLVNQACRRVEQPEFYNCSRR